jgi:hypothetical protein
MRLTGTRRYHINGEAVGFIQFDVLCNNLSEHFPVGGFNL